jgi:hypothetical protein
MRKPIRTIIHLGSGEEGKARKDTLETIAAEHGAISQRDEPSIGCLLVMIADGQLIIEKYQKLAPVRPGKDE